MILVIEDDKYCQKIYDLIFNKLNINFHLVDNGKDAKKMLMKNNYDKVMIDMLLPDMNGIDIAKFILQEKIETEIIICSADESVLGDVSIYTNQILQKPITIDYIESHLLLKKN